jgi:hypothetical protein
MNVFGDDYGVEEIVPSEERIHYEWLLEKAIADAEKRGCIVVHSTPTLILLDMDTGASRDTFRNVYPTIQGKFNLQYLEEWKSQHGNTHILVSCDPLPFTCRIAIAACLGSDPVREALAIAMFQDGLEEPSVLFRPADSVVYIV